MQAIWEYIRSLYKHGVYSVTSTIFAVVATVWGLTGGRALTVGALAGIAIALFVVAGYQAWKEKRDALNVLFNPKATADFLGQILVETNHWWDTGCRVRPDVTEATAWCTEYDHWMVGLKERVAGKLGTTEMVAIFQIGPGLLDAPHAVGATIEQQHRMRCLKLHMEELKEALKRYLPGFAAE